MTQVPLNPATRDKCNCLTGRYISSLLCMAPERHKYLSNACWLTELDSTRWFGKTPVCLRTGASAQVLLLMTRHHVDSLFGENPIHRLPASGPAHYSLCLDEFSTFTLRSLRHTGIMLISGVGSTSRFLCRQFTRRVNYPPALHRDGTHTPFEYVLHSWFIPSDVAMSTHETSQMAVEGAEKTIVAAYFTVLGMDGKPWTIMRVQRQRRYGNAVCPSGADTFVSLPISKKYGMRTRPLARLSKGMVGRSERDDNTESWGKAYGIDKCCPDCQRKGRGTSTQTERWTLSWGKV